MQYQSSVTMGFFNSYDMKDDFLQRIQQFSKQFSKQCYFIQFNLNCTLWDKRLVKIGLIMLHEHVIIQSMIELYHCFVIPIFRRFSYRCHVYVSLVIPNKNVRKFIWSFVWVFLTELCLYMSDLVDISKIGLGDCKVFLNTIAKC